MAAAPVDELCMSIKHASLIYAATDIMYLLPCEGFRAVVALMLPLTTPISSSSAKEAARDPVVSGVVGVSVLEDFINALAMVSLPGTGSAVLVLLRVLPEKEECDLSLYCCILCIELVDEPALLVFMKRSATERRLLLPVVGMSERVEFDNVVDTDGEHFCVAAGVGSGGA